jgi:hypothetical protein
VPGRVARPLTVSVLDTDDTGAFCWRSGAVYVTRGLVDLLDDDELAAAIAHEVGHLLLDGHTPRAAALDGCRLHPSPNREDAETAADFMGRELLKTSAVPDEALPRLLSKLAERPATASTCRDCLARRVARLTSPTASTGVSRACPSGASAPAN